MQDINEKEAFSQRFKQKLAEHGWTINSPTWLAREFNLRYSGQSAYRQQVIGCQERRFLVRINCKYWLLGWMFQVNG